MKPIRSLVVVPVLVVGRDADARERAEDRHPRRGQPGSRRRARTASSRDSASRIGTCTRIPLATWIALSGSSSADVDVQAEDQLLARDEAQLVDQVAVARRGGDPLVLPARERVRAGRADAQPLLVGDVANLTPQRRAARAPASRMSAHGFVEISSTDSISSGLMSPSRRVLEQVVDRVDQRVACPGRGSSAPPRCRPCTRGR